MRKRIYLLSISASLLIFSFREMEKSIPAKYLVLDSPLQDTLIIGYENIIKIKNTGKRPFRDLFLESEAGSVRRIDSLRQFRIKVPATYAGKKVNLTLKDKNQLMEERTCHVSVLTNKMVPRFKKYNELNK